MDAYLQVWLDSCPQRMRGASLEQVNLSQVAATPNVAQQVVDALHNWGQHPRSLILTGPSGAGKTYLACAAVRHLLAGHPWTTMYTSLPAVDILGRTGIQMWRESATGCDLLVIDDIDQPSDSVRRLRQVLMERYNRQKPTVACSIADRDHWTDFLDEWLVRRLTDGALSIRFGD